VRSLCSRVVVRSAFSEIEYTCDKLSDSSWVHGACVSR